jgi:CO/xanthine dehydrogenase Mo-binding subunit
MTIIGKRVTRIDAHDKVTGRAIFGHDLKVPGMLHAKILRSSFAHALIREIDTSRAEKVAGVVSVITGRNTVSGPLGYLKEHPILKSDRVRSLRDEVAAVAATSEEAAQEACSLIVVKYDPLPAVFDPFEAIQPGAPQIHDHAPRNRIPLNLDFKAGDTDRALDRSEYIVEATYRTSFVSHCCMEPCFALASFDTAGRLTLRSTTQAPYLMQNTMAKCLGIPGHRIRVIQTAIGGAFGAKLDVYPYEVITALLARASGRPVRITYTREEEFACSPTRQPTVIKMSTGCNREGLLTARKCEATLDAGAYTSLGFATPRIMLLGISSLYKVENVHFRSRSIYTNNPYSGAFRGYGQPQANFANEQQMDELARKVGIDPVSFRIINANKPGSTTPQKLKITTCGLKDCIEKAAGTIGFDRKKETWEGVGIASAIQVGGGARVQRSDGSGAVVKNDDFGRVSIITGATETGTGADTALAMIAAEELGVPLERISVIRGDTDMGLWDAGDYASRTTFVAGNAVLRACRIIRKKIVEHASNVLRCSAGEVMLRNGGASFKSSSTRTLSIDRIVRAIHFREGGEALVASVYFDPLSEPAGKDLKGNISAAYSFATHAVRLRVDPLTGKIKILNWVAVHDSGRIINLNGADGQIHGAIQQGIGYTLMENLQLEEGRVLNPSFRDYKMQTCRDMPEAIEVHFVETEDPAGPYGAKGVSEAGIIPVPAAIANAIADATGLRIRSLPITPEKIHTALMERE